MSFPNPDNYARDCDCGTAGANTTPPPAQLIAEAEATILTNPLILPLGGSIDTRTKGGTGGYINTSGDEGNQSGGYIDTSALGGGSSGGYINTSGNDDAGGSIDTRGSNTGNGPGGNIFTYGTTNGAGGTINLSSTSTGANAPHILCGTGVPSVSAPNGSIFLRVNGTSSSTLYVRAADAWSALS
jgi:hypothetical protein